MAAAGQTGRRRVVEAASGFHGKLELIVHQIPALCKSWVFLRDFYNFFARAKNPGLRGIFPAGRDAFIGQMYGPLPLFIEW